MKAEEKEILIPYSGDEIECPACCERIIPMALVKVKPGNVRTVGSSGFNQPNLSVSVETELLGIKIQHDCTIKNPRGV